MKKLEDWQPLFRALVKFDNSSVVGLAVLSIFTLFVCLATYWIWFAGGGEKWQQGIIKWHGDSELSKQLYSVNVLKGFSLIFLLVTIVMLVIIAQSEISKL